MKLQSDISMPCRTSAGTCLLWPEAAVALRKAKDVQEPVSERGFFAGPSTTWRRRKWPAWRAANRSTRPPDSATTRPSRWTTNSPFEHSGRTPSWIGFVAWRPSRCPTITTARGFTAVGTSLAIPYPSRTTVIRPPWRVVAHPAIVARCEHRSLTSRCPCEVPQAGEPDNSYFQSGLAAVVGRS